MMPKGLRITKATLYLAAAILILIFHEKIMPFVAFLVGGVVLAYALEELIFLIAEKKFADMAESIVQIVLAVLLFLAHNDIAKVCVIWGVWSVIRESRQMSQALPDIRKHFLAIVNVAESVAIIVLSAMMILIPDEHHARIHVIVLAVELTLEIVFPFLEKLLYKFDQPKENTAD